MPPPGEATSPVQSSSLVASGVAPAHELVGIQIEPPFGILTVDLREVAGQWSSERRVFPPEVLPPDVAAAVAVVRDFARSLTR